MAQNNNASEGKGKPKSEGAASRFTAREELDKVCGLSRANDGIRLLKASYIIELNENKQVLAKRQELPDHAFWNTEIKRKTPVVSVSHPWFSVEHPDPDGRHVAVLAPLLEQYIEHLKREKELPYDDICDVAVFIDWASLYQKERTEDQTHTFKGCLRDMSLMYAHARTVVWCLTKIQPGMNQNRPYHSRGWCAFEHRIASIITTGNRLLDLGLLEIKPNEVTDFRNQVETLKLERKPPLLPEEFRNLLSEKTSPKGNRYTFTNGADRGTVITRYEHTFVELLNEVDRLEFNRLKWSDEDVAQLVKVLPYCPNLKSLLLHTNSFGDDTARALCKVFPESLEQLDARNNGLSFVFEEDYPYGDTNVHHLSKTQKKERVEWRKGYLKAFKKYYAS